MYKNAHAAIRSNPDPKKAVRFGNQTFDEMMIGYFDWYETEPSKATDAGADQP